MSTSDKMQSGPGRSRGSLRHIVTVLGLCALVACSSSSNSTGPITPITSSEINADALWKALNRPNEPKLLIFKGNMTSGSSNEDRFTDQLEAHVYAVSLADEAVTELTLDAEANAVTLFLLETEDRGDSFSDILRSRTLIEGSPLEGYERRGEVSGVLERGQYVMVLWPTGAIGYRLAAAWQSP